MSAGCSLNSGYSIAGTAVVYPKNGRDKRPVRFHTHLLSDSQLCDAGSIALDILGHQVVQQTAALTDHLVQAETGMIVLLMDLQMLGQLGNAFGQNGNLNLRRTGIVLMGAVCVNNRGFLFLGNNG